MPKLTTGEPTHEDADGKERPGSQDLKSVVNPELVSSADTAWASHSSDSKVRNNYSALDGNTSEPFSAIENLIVDAFQSYGNQSPATIPGDIKLILLRRSSRIIEDIRIHPYSSTPDIDYYRALTDVRPIPDVIVSAGLLYQYALWMSSPKAALYAADYYQILNSTLYQRKYGSGKIQMNTVDKEPGAI